MSECSKKGVFGSFFLSSLFFSSGHFTNPDGQAATEFLAEQRRGRITAERRDRPQPTRAERDEARRQRILDRQLEDFMSAPSVYTAEEERELNFFQF